MTIRFIERSESEDISMSIFLGRAGSQSDWVDLIFMIATGIALLAYVGCFSVLRFRREKMERAEFNLVKYGVKAVPSSEAKRRIAA